MSPLTLTFCGSFSFLRSNGDTRTENTSGRVRFFSLFKNIGHYIFIRRVRAGHARTRRSVGGVGSLKSGQFKSLTRRLTHLSFPVVPDSKCSVCFLNVKNETRETESQRSEEIQMFTTTLSLWADNKVYNQFAVKSVNRQTDRQTRSLFLCFLCLSRWFLKS